MQEGVDQSSFLVARSDMHDHASRLVDDEQIIILVQDFQGNVLGSGSGRWLRRLLLDTEEISRLHLFIVFDQLSSQGDSSGFHQGLDLGTRKMREITNENHVDPLAAILLGGGDFVDCGFGHGK